MKVVLYERYDPGKLAKNFFCIEIITYLASLGPCLGGSLKWHYFLNSILKEIDSGEKFYEVNFFCSSSMYITCRRATNSFTSIFGLGQQFGQKIGLKLGN